MFNGAAEAMRGAGETRCAREARGFAVSLTEYVHRDFSLIDVTAPTATKGHALAWRAEQLGLTRERGDGRRRQLQRSRDAGVRRHAGA